MQFIDYYSVLGVGQSASMTEIKMAYRSLVKKYHPDVNHSPDANIQMQLINEAYLILSDLQARSLYDIEWSRYFEAKTTRSQAKQSNANDNYESEAEESHHFQSDKLNDWVEKARKQASDITAQALKDTGGIVREASKGILNGVGQIFIYFFIINIIFLLVKSC